MQYRQLFYHISVVFGVQCIYIGIFTDNNTLQSFFYLGFLYTMLHRQFLKHTSALIDVFYIYIGILTYKNKYNLFSFRLPELMYIYKYFNNISVI
jgi:hypothetical protein